MRIFAAGILGLGLIAAAPVSAQIAGSMRGLSGSPSIRGDILREAPADPRVAQRVSIGREVRDIRDQIRDGRDAGQLSRREARALRREGLRIEAASDRYGRDGYSDAELMMLRSRTEALRSAMTAKRTQGLAGK
ncbi:hypothetical protein FHS95_000608 [Sphingomonas naasensis]|uniref:DUF4168 domain-containing protein n=1 Tax=Sphingomonas naasensis TaxID=1344951 RepID=A0A4S1WTT5_9SPHN|nr:hypothetical protein [Sphingomonas naasensis]NIJ18939.1 hypothetical protein [Sphingomonas naasensis]TGX46155.1 hypothetical protein E5A74_03040 [Sphingomonas naasensis]